MVMDRGLSEQSAIMSARIEIDGYFVDQTDSRHGDDPFHWSAQSLINLPFDPPDPKSHSNCQSVPCSGVNPDGNSPEDCEIFSDIALNYISQMLLEGDLEGQSSLYPESSELQAAEKPFYEILGEKYPPSPDQHPILDDCNAESPDDSVEIGKCANCGRNCSSTNSSSADGNSIGNVSEYSSSLNLNTLFPNFNSQLLPLNSSKSFNHYADGVDESSRSEIGFAPLRSRSLTSDTCEYSSSQNSITITSPTCSICDSNFGDGVEYSKYKLGVADSHSDSLISSTGEQHSAPQNLLTASINCACQSSLSFGSNSISNFADGPVWQFQKGVEEANKFLPNQASLLFDVDTSGFLIREPKEGIEVKEEKDEERDQLINVSRGRKNLHPDDLELEGARSNKQTAIFPDRVVRSKDFDMVLLCGGHNCRSALEDLQESLQTGVSKNSQNKQGKGSSGGGKSRGKKQGRTEVVDLRTLLIQCAQAVAANNLRAGSELLKKIRQHSSPYGDGSQRLAHYFANGLEARLAGTGSQIYMEFANKRTTAAYILKAYHLFLAACPFRKISHFFANQTILDTVDNAAQVHIVDFGINFGFQWPCLLQRLSGRSKGPPKVRITGIDLPQPGFRPAERVEETGRRLSDYAETFNVPFDYTPIACNKWETIKVEDLKIDRDEVLIVNCSYQFNKLADETVAIDSPRDTVLKTIRKMNPDVFIHGIVNGSYSAPFFITRFREALFYWSSMYDMLETIVPREQPERMLIERDLFGREAINTIACEGLERVERPETYKQWRVRTMRAGFLQLPLKQDIMKKARDKVRTCYHKDFVIDEDRQWMLQGWKGRIVCALSTWKPDK